MHGHRLRGRDCATLLMGESVSDGYYVRKKKGRPGGREKNERERESLALRDIELE